MNEQIQKLAREAALAEGWGPGVWQTTFTEKFAESIMRECISVMKSTVDESIDFDRKLDETSYWIESDIKKHFGVEE